MHPPESQLERRIARDDALHVLPHRHPLVEPERLRERQALQLIILEIWLVEYPRMQIDPRLEFEPTDLPRRLQDFELRPTRRLAAGRVPSPAIVRDLRAQCRLRARQGIRHEIEPIRDRRHERQSQNRSATTTSQTITTRPQFIDNPSTGSRCAARLPSPRCATTCRSPDTAA